VQLLVGVARPGLAITGRTARLPPAVWPKCGTQLIKRKGLTQRRPFEFEFLVVRDSVSRSENNPKFRADRKRASRQFGARHVRHDDVSEQDVNVVPA
jgi:hypothetical protein